jgi:hypothetical protein
MGYEKSSLQSKTTYSCHRIFTPTEQPFYTRETSSMPWQFWSLHQLKVDEVAVFPECGITG